MTALSLKDELADQHIRLTAPDRPCDRCLKLPPAGETLTIAYIRFKAATVPFSICESCTAAELDRFKGHAMSHDAASIFMCHQEQGLNKLSDELVAMNDWIAQNSAPGKPCDECGASLVEGEPTSTATVAMTGAITDRSILHIVCPRCARTTMPRIRAKCDRFVGRIVSTRSTAFIPDLINPKKVVN